MNVVQVSADRSMEFKQLLEQLDAANRTMIEITKRYDAKQIDAEAWHRIHHAALHEATSVMAAIQNFNRNP